MEAAPRLAWFCSDLTGTAGPKFWLRKGAGRGDDAARPLACGSRRPPYTEVKSGADYWALLGFPPPHCKLSIHAKSAVTQEIQSDLKAQRSGAEVFGAAFAGSWAIATLLGLGTIGARLLDGLFVLCGIVVMVLFVRSARRIEPFVAAEHRSVRR